MPDDSKKTQDKRKNDPKEQRKPRNSRNQSSKQERKAQMIQDSKSTPKVAQKPPVYDDPGPEFYKGLKRETEEILKKTEEENSKYKKKEIQSNWSKYEMPIESYDEIEEHDIGADYEKLIQAPLSIGGHFQFKHEKSWDINTGPSLYDKYFDIDMDNLSLAISTIPFYERNDIEKTIFSETDMVNMTKRSEKYIEKYLNDKSVTSKSSNICKSKNNEHVRGENESVEIDNKQASRPNTNLDERTVEKDIILDFNKLKTDILNPVHSQKQNMYETAALKINAENNIELLLDKNIVDQTKKVMPELKSLHIDCLESQSLPPKEIENLITEVSKPPMVTKKPSNTTEIEMRSDIKNTADAPAVTKDPVIESPEDLEKWLDDFLDG